MMLSLLLACAGPSEGLRAGDYTVQTVGMEDACLDGALEALFMPQGPETPQVFEYPVPIPGLDELPADIDVDLRAPFVGIPLHVTSGGDGRLVGVGTMDSVLLDEGLYGDCVAAMEVRVVLDPLSREVAEGTCEIDLSDLRGADERCPSLAEEPCRVTLSLYAEAE